MGRVSAGAAALRGHEFTVVVASNNRKKLVEIADALPFEHWRFVAAGEMDGDWPSPEEDGDTFRDNALIKARAAHARFGIAALADDSGLEVDALGGEPGVRSSRYSGENATDAENNALLMSELEAVPDDLRTARFRCCIAFIDADGSETVVDGACEGRIAHVPRGEHGFGYDPLFLPDATPGRSMAELTLSEKSALSHRGAALRALREALEGR